MTEKDMIITIFRLAAEMPYDHLIRTMKFIEKLKSEPYKSDPDDEYDPEEA
jgi:hypothetical protein